MHLAGEMLHLHRLVCFNRSPAAKAIYSTLTSFVDTHNCFTYIDKEALADSTKSVRVAVKDNIAVQGMPLTCASPVLRNYIASFDADIIRLLLQDQKGYIVVGKTNMDEFGLGSSTTHSIYGPTLNALHPETWSAGGSSGGSAVAVSLGLCDIGLGSDTGGSVRLPAACNGIYGFKPTRGRISRHGLVSYASSLDTIGIMARSVLEIRNVFETVKDRGSDPIMQHNPSTVPKLDTRKPRVIGKHIRAYKHQKEFLEQLGRLVGSVFGILEFPFLEEHDLLETYMTIATVEAYSNLARYTPNAPFHRIPSGDQFGPVVRARVQHGKENVWRLESAMQIRTRIRAELFDHHTDMHILACPVLPDVPLRERLVNDSRSEFDRLTVLANLANCPAISVPLAHSSVLAIQFLSPPHTDEQLLDFVASLHNP